jgi:hypothetical protein
MTTVTAPPTIRKSFHASLDGAVSGVAFATSDHRYFFVTPDSSMLELHDADVPRLTLLGDAAETLGQDLDVVLKGGLAGAVTQSAWRLARER